MLKAQSKKERNGKKTNWNVCSLDRLNISISWLLVWGLWAKFLLASWGRTLFDRISVMFLVCGLAGFRYFASKIGGKETDNNNNNNNNNNKMKSEQNTGMLFLAGLEPATFRVLGGRDNHYTTETELRYVRSLLWSISLLNGKCETDLITFTSITNYSMISCVIRLGVGWGGVWMTNMLEGRFEGRNDIISSIYCCCHAFPLWGWGWVGFMVAASTHWLAKTSALNGNVSG